MATNSIKLLTGNSHPQLAKLVAERYVLEFLYCFWLVGGVEYFGREGRGGEGFESDDGILRGSGLWVRRRDWVSFWVDGGSH